MARADDTYGFRNGPGAQLIGMATTKNRVWVSPQATGLSQIRVPSIIREHKNCKVRLDRLDCTVVSLWYQSCASRSPSRDIQNSPEAVGEKSSPK